MIDFQRCFPGTNNGEKLPVDITGAEIFLRSQRIYDKIMQAFNTLYATERDQRSLQQRRSRLGNFRDGLLKSLGAKKIDRKKWRLTVVPGTYGRLVSFALKIRSEMAKAFGNQGILEHLDAQFRTMLQEEVQREMEDVRDTIIMAADAAAQEAVPRQKLSADLLPPPVRASSSAQPTVKTVRLECATAEPNTQAIFSAFIAENEPDAIVAFVESMHTASEGQEGALIILLRGKDWDLAHFKQLEVCLADYKIAAAILSSIDANEQPQHSQKKNNRNAWEIVFNVLRRRCTSEHAFLECLAAHRLHRNFRNHIKGREDRERPLPHSPGPLSTPSPTPMERHDTTEGASIARPAKSPESAGSIPASPPIADVQTSIADAASLTLRIEEAFGEDWQFLPEHNKRRFVELVALSGMSPHADGSRRYVDADRAKAIVALINLCADTGMPLGVLYKISGVQFFQWVQRLEKWNKKNSDSAISVLSSQDSKALTRLTAEIAGKIPERFTQKDTSIRKRITVWLRLKRKALLKQDLSPEDLEEIQVKAYRTRLIEPEFKGWDLHDLAPDLFPIEAPADERTAEPEKLFVAEPEVSTRESIASVESRRMLAENAKEHRADAPERSPMTDLPLPAPVTSGQESKPAAADFAGEGCTAPKQMEQRIAAGILHSREQALAAFGQLLQYLASSDAALLSLQKEQGSMSAPKTIVSS